MGTVVVSVRIPLGQYVAGDSALHRLDPRVKLGLVGVYVIVVFLVGSWWGLAALAACVVVGIALSGVPWRLVARGVRPVLVVLVFTLALNALVLGAADALVSIGPVDVSRAGLARGLFFAARIVLVMLGTTLLTLVTSPVALTDAFARLLGPLERVRVPSADIAMMLSIALRFVPTTAEEADRIVVAQTARGARFDVGGPVTRVKAYVPVLVPLFVNLFRRAEDLAFAMEARAYRGRGRSHLYERRMTWSDWSVLVSALVLGAVLAVYL